MSLSVKENEKYFEEELAELRNIINDICKTNTDIYRDTIKREYLLLNEISKLMSSALYFRTYDLNERTKLNCELKKLKLNIGYSESELKMFKQEIQRGLDSRKRVEKIHLKQNGIEDTSIAVYKKLIESDVFLHYYFGNK